jgi:hypothetical protein
MDANRARENLIWRVNSRLTYQLPAHVSTLILRLAGCIIPNALSGIAVGVQHGLPAGFLPPARFP